MTYLLDVNGSRREVQADIRTSLLDVLREHLGLTGTKKGCDHGQCGACTVLDGDRRVLSCLTLGITAQGHSITTIEGVGGIDGVGGGSDLHPLQQEFIARDAFQCGYCTPGQICSAIGMLTEVAAGWPSAVTADVGKSAVELDADEVRERMSGNLCRCGAYANIVPAVLAVAEQRQ